ncbi:hypothetical protein ACF0H5_016980 [Mactra antiquata]
MIYLFETILHYKVLQYIFCCPFKAVAECCLVRDEDDTMVTKWSLQNKSFCQWMCSSVECDKPECRQPCTVCCSCKGENSCQTECCCKTCCPGLSECQCLGIKEHLNSLWSYLKMIFCCKCAKDNENLTCCMFCKKCSQCLNCNCCKCSSCTCEQMSCVNCCSTDNCTSCVCTQPTKCPTYEVELSSRMNIVPTCPMCPANVLCFSCSETEAVRCCCHYIFLNRCGDPTFDYKEKKDICTCNRDSCCTFLFELIFWLCQACCVGCYTTCENSAMCCGNSCIACFKMSVCQCSDIDLCSNFGCLCFDCKKLDESNNEAGDTSLAEKNNVNVEDSDIERTNSVADAEVDITKCGCFLFKNFAFSFPRPSESNVPPGFKIFTPPGGGKVEVPNNIPDDILTRLYLAAARSNTTPGMAMSMPNFEQTSSRNLMMHRTASLPNREYVPDEYYEQSRQGYSNHDIYSQQGNSHMMAERWSMSRASHEDYSDHEYDLEDQSMADNRHMNRLQRQLLNDEVHYERERDIDSHRSLSSYRPRKHQSSTMSSMSRRQSSLNDYPTGHSGILKAHSKYNEDDDNGHYIDRDDAHRGKKHAHFQDEDPELYGELFPRQHSYDLKETNIDEENFVGEHTRRRNRLKRQSNFDKSRDITDTDSDDYGKPIRHKKHRRKPYSRDLSSADDDDYVDTQPSTSGSSRHHRGQHNYGTNMKSQEYIEMKRRGRRSSSKNRHYVNDVPRLNLESNDEVSDDRYARASRKHWKNRRDLETSSGYRPKRDYDEEENRIGSRGFNRDSIEDTRNVSRKKSVAERMKELREKSTLSESD